MGLKTGSREQKVRDEFAGHVDALTKRIAELTTDVATRGAQLVDMKQMIIDKGLFDAAEQAVALSQIDDVIAWIDSEAATRLGTLPPVPHADE